jgi:putative transposase
MMHDDTGRRLLRLQGYDYSQAGGYFITLCTRDRAQLFGKITDSKMQLSPTGEIARHAWRSLPEWFPYVALDCYVIMPNHIHGVLLLLPEDSKTLAVESSIERDSASVGRDYSMAGTPPKSLGSVIQAYKSRVTRQCNQQCGENSPLWQRGYYDHVIRDELGLERIREYVTWNPAQWALDKENQQHTALNPFYDWLETCSGAPPA